MAKTGTARFLEEVNRRMEPALYGAMDILHKHYALRVQQLIVQAGSRRSRPGEYPAKDFGHGVANWLRNGVIIDGLEVQCGFNEKPATSDPEDDGGMHMAELTTEEFNRLGPDDAFFESLSQMRLAFRIIARR